MKLGRPIVLVLMLVLSACALPDVSRSMEKGSDQVDQAYVLLAVFNEVDAAALEFVQHPDTPAEVKTVLKKLRGELNARFEALSWKLGRRLDAGEHFGAADFDAIVAEVKDRDARWANI